MTGDTASTSGTPATGLPVIEAQDVTCNLGPVTPVRGASFEVAPGELVALLGPSGSGKTTLLNLLCGWQRPSDGVIRFGGYVVDPGTLSWADLAVVPQSVGLLDELTAAENVGLPCRLAGVPDRQSSELFEHLDLVELAARRPRQLSLGECQRVAMARALVLAPRLLLADEPTSHQDARRGQLVLDLLRAQAAQGTACILSTHDRDLVGAADRVLVMENGRPVAR